MPRRPYFGESPAARADPRRMSGSEIPETGALPPWVVDPDGLDAPTPQAVTARPPDFLIIGAQKSGTTWLHENLWEHPELWLPPVKELHFLNQKFAPSADGWESAYRRRIAEDVRQFLRTCRIPGQEMYRQKLRSGARVLDLCALPEIDERTYLRIFASAGSTPLCGEATPEYCMLEPEAVDHAILLNPRIRAILIMRDPVARAVSHIRMLHGYGEIRSPAEGVDPMYLDGAVTRSDYGPMIERWRSRLADGSLHLAAYEDIAEDSGQFLENVCTFLGIRAERSLFPNRDKVVFRGEPFDVHAQVLATLEERLAHVYSDMRRLAPAVAERWQRFRA